jgi:hypothetical protein
MGLPWLLGLPLELFILAAMGFKFCALPHICNP